MKKKNKKRPYTADCYILKVRLSDDERRALETLAEQLGTTVSSVVRQFIRRTAKMPCTFDELDGEDA